jgi:fucokinase
MDRPKSSRPQVAPKDSSSAGAWAEDIRRALRGGHPSKRREDAENLEALDAARVLHSLGTAVLKLSAVHERPAWFKSWLAALYRGFSAAERSRLETLGLRQSLAGRPAAWGRAAQDAAFEHIARTIVLSRPPLRRHPKNALRSDEIIWGRAPARLDLGGGWTDTPPYALERGGCVINAAVDLNGQPPIQVYARVVAAPEIRISSIDHGSRIVIRTLGELLDYRHPTSQFGLAKAALALAGFSSETALWPRGTRTLRDMLRAFGGGIELTTLAAIPSGSGLGTSSIMGAVLAAVVQRMTGREPGARELFHDVLRLEQELTTGGGWQDQVGGVLPGVKMITTRPGLIPDPRIHYVTSDVLDPKANGGQTLLYYTGLRRLAKNILRNVVGNYLDRDPAAMKTLAELHAFPRRMSEAMAAKDAAAFGRLIDVAWRLNKRIDPASTTPDIETVLAKIRRHIYGAKLLGAGGGGFLMIAARSPEDARRIRAKLEAAPPNGRARFFDFGISREGLSVTVC